MDRRERFLADMGFELGPSRRADLTPEDLANPILRAFQDGVRPEFVKEEIRRKFPNVPDFDAKYVSALNVLANSPQMVRGKDEFGRSLSESRGFLGFLRMVFNIVKPAAEVIKDPTKLPEVITQQFQERVVKNAPENLRQPLTQASNLAKKGIQSDLGKKLIEKL